jgi:hypothetical protein
MKVSCTNCANEYQWIFYSVVSSLNELKFIVLYIAETNLLRQFQAFYLPTRTLYLLVR